MKFTKQHLEKLKTKGLIKPETFDGLIKKFADGGVVDPLARAPDSEKKFAYDFGAQNTTGDAVLDKAIVNAKANSIEQAKTVNQVSKPAKAISKPDPVKEIDKGTGKTIDPSSVIKKAQAAMKEMPAMPLGQKSDPSVIDKQTLATIKADLDQKLKEQLKSFDEVDKQLKEHQSFAEELEPQRQRQELEQAQQAIQAKKDLRAMVIEDQANLATALRIAKARANETNENALKLSQIDPKRFWNNSSTPSKILMAIGMIAGGQAGSDSIEKIIEKDIAAQIADQQRVLSLAKDSNENYKNLIYDATGIYKVLLDAHKDPNIALNSSAMTALQRAKLMLDQQVLLSSNAKEKARMIQESSKLAVSIAQFQNENDQILYGNQLKERKLGLEERKLIEAKNKMELDKYGKKPQGQRVINKDADPYTRINSELPEKQHIKAIEELGFHNSMVSLSKEVTRIIDDWEKNLKGMNPYLHPYEYLRAKEKLRGSLYAPMKATLGDALQPSEAKSLIDDRLPKLLDQYAGTPELKKGIFGMLESTWYKHTGLISSSGIVSSPFKNITNPEFKTMKVKGGK